MKDVRHCRTTATVSTFFGELCCELQKNRLPETAERTQDPGSLRSGQNIQRFDTPELAAQ